MSIDVKLRVAEIQRFCMHDGPGLRTTVFLKGCPLRCQWCHNPETQISAPQLLFYKSKCILCGACASVCTKGAHLLTESNEHVILRKLCTSCGECASICPTAALDICGKEMTVDEIISVVQRDSAFYGDTGGITISGGEPFMQKNATVALLKACREKGISTAVETCGYADPNLLSEAIPYVDLFLWDIKDTSEERHIRYTGASNQPILKNLSLINEKNARIRLRCILVNGVNTNKEHYENIAKIARSLNNPDGVELIPYHAYSGTKATFIGLDDNGRSDWIPDSEQIKEARLTLEELGAFVL